MTTQELAPQTEPTQIEMLEQALVYAESTEQQGHVDPELESLLVAEADKIKADDLYSGGFTIPGTDEWIPGQKTVTYKLESVDEAGRPTSEHIPEEFAVKLLSYKAAHSKKEASAAEATPSTAETAEPTNGRKHRRAERPQTHIEPKARTEAEPKVEAKEQPLKKHRRAERAQGPAAATAGEAQNETKQAGAATASTEVKDAADLVGLDARNRGHRPDGKFLSKHEVELIAEHQGLIRSGIGKNVAKSPEPMHDDELITSVHPVGSSSITFTADNLPASVADSPEATGENETGDLQEPIVDPSPAGMHRRRRSLMGRAADAIGSAPWKAYDRALEYFGDAERGRRRKTVAAVVGTLAIAGVAYLEMRGHIGGRTHSNGNSLGDYNAPPVAPKVSPEAAEHAEKLLKGHTIWGDVNKIAASHHHNLSGVQTKGYVDQILQHNHLTYEQARHLPVGYHWEIPQHVYEQLAKAK